MGQTEKNSVRAYVFRFALKLGHCSTHSACLKGANCRLMHRSKYASSLDHLVGAGEQGRWQVEAKRLRRLEVDHNLEFSRRLRW